MRKLAAIFILIALAMSVQVGVGEAGWKKRGWYLKNQTTQCVMRKVVVRGANGKVVIKRVRVCG